MLFISICRGIMGALGYGTVLINGESVTGITALPASVLIGAVFIGAFTVISRPLKITVID
ncbi:hypothetical protein R7Q53_000747 [Morganella morganii]|nr:hypothetical protein [Morganella morganii]